jgi:hypothetical protein
MIKVVVLAVIELKQVLKIVEDLADYIALGVTGEIEFKRACEQIVQLNYSLDALQQRYNKAKKDNHKSFRYSLRLRIAVVDGANIF